MYKTLVNRLHGKRLLRVGDLVEIRPLAEIVATLDDKGGLDGMPFMPEMAKYCGQRAIVTKRAHKTCDGHGNLRWLDDTVHLDGLHCDGSAHGGCQARCLTYWKTAWLKRVARGEAGPQPPVNSDAEPLLARLGSATCETTDDTVRYMCQSTEVNVATKPLPIGQLKQYLWDVTSGNYTVAAFLRIMAKAIFNRYQRWSTEHLPPVLWFRDGNRLDHIEGHGIRTPKMTLELAIGERVRIRPRHEIEATLSKSNANRGLLFDSEDATWCESSSKVIDRIERFVDDQTGEMIEIKSDCVMLDGVGCRGEYWRMCSRGLPTYWREIWLEREP